MDRMPLSFTAADQPRFVLGRVQFQAPAANGTKLSFALLLLFLMLLYANIAVLAPSLEALRPMLVIALATISMMWIEKSVSGEPLVFVWPESYLLALFLGAGALSIGTALWMRQSLEYTMDLAKIVTIYLIIINTVDSEKRLRLFMWCMTLGGLIPTLMT